VDLDETTDPRVPSVLINGDCDDADVPEGWVGLVRHEDASGGARDRVDARLRELGVELIDDPVSSSPPPPVEPLESTREIPARGAICASIQSAANAITEVAFCGLGDILSVDILRLGPWVRVDGCHAERLIALGGKASEWVADLDGFSPDTRTVELHRASAGIHCVQAVPRGSRPEGA
jgi:hypothetical protein